MTDTQSLEKLLKEALERIQKLENKVAMQGGVISGASKSAAAQWNGGYVTNPTYFEALAQINDTWEELDEAGFLQKLYRTATNEPEDHPFDARDAELRWWDVSTGNYINAFPFLLTVGAESTPWLLIDQALSTRKDFYALGMLTSGEGVLCMYGGVGWGPDGFNSNPFIWLAKGGIYGSKDTFEIRKTITGPAWGWGGLASGEISVSGSEVITADRVLQNVTANASIIDEGTFDTARIPDLDAAKIVSGTFATARIPNLDAAKITSGTFDTARIPTITYSMTNFANQNLNQSNDAIFNSVKGTSGTGALKAGNEGTVGWDTNNLHITSHTKNLLLETLGTKDVLVSGNSISPETSNVEHCGLETQYWNSGWFNYLRYKDLDSFDALDDLALAKNYKTKRVTENGIEREVIDHESLPFLQSGTKKQFFDAGKVCGFLLGCVRQLTEEVDNLRKELNQLKAA